MVVEDVDLLLLSRDEAPLRPDVRAGIEAQRGVRLRVYRLTGTRYPGDVNRFETIVRARNAGREIGTASLVMLLDDDVVLGPGCVARLAEGLRRRPVFSALAADSDGDMGRGLDHWDYPRHVGMAAVLFRREHLRRLTFRWEPGKCECLCCCEDLRRAGLGIGYLEGAEAWHRPSPHHAEAPTAPPASDQGRPPDPGRWSVFSPALPPGPPPPAAGAASPPGRVMAAFDRKHLRLFLRRFVGSFRRAGNAETITAVASGLRPSERRLVAATPGVELEAVPEDGHPAQRRVPNFRRVVGRWPDETPVAYWDAADVVFQARLGPLWDLVRAHPDRLLAVTEEQTFREATVALWWATSVRDDAVRARALDLILDRNVLNSGFAAGTAWAMKRYLDAVGMLIDSGTLDGSTDFGDQTAMNLYLHANPDAWLEIHSGWNYCLVGLPPGRFRVRPDGWTERLDGEPLHVVHGAAKTLREWDLVHLTS